MTGDAPSRLHARPGSAVDVGEGRLAPGLHRLGAGDARGGLVYVPAGLREGRPSPLVVNLHGAGSSGAAALPERLVSLADGVGAVVLAPDSRGPTWDVLLGGFGPDVAFIDAALARVFSAVSVDPRRLAIAGFSDGASYALSLGLGNGDLFTHVMAFSPGFMAPDAQRGRPLVFVAHGTADPVLRIEHCSRPLVGILEQMGYVVRYVEFPGGHELPTEVVGEAFAWLGES